jgi:hypothetical protein
MGMEVREGRGGEGGEGTYYGQALLGFGDLGSRGCWIGFRRGFG